MENIKIGKGLSVPNNPAMALRELNRQHTKIEAENNTTILQQNNTTILQSEGAEAQTVVRRDGRTHRNRQTASTHDATIVTSFRITAATMDALDEFCFRNRIRKQDVVQRALEEYLAKTMGTPLAPTPAPE